MVEKDATLLVGRETGNSVRKEPDVPGKTSDVREALEMIGRTRADGESGT